MVSASGGVRLEQAFWIASCFWRSIEAMPLALNESHHHLLDLGLQLVGVGERCGERERERTDQFLHVMSSLTLHAGPLGLAAVALAAP